MPSAVGTALIGLWTSLGGSVTAATVASATTLGTTAIAAASLATTIGTTAYSASQSRKQAQAEQRRLEAQKRIASLRNERERTNQTRAYRIKRAENIAAGQASGADSSGQEGATASLGSKLASNLSFMDQVSSLTNKISNEDAEIYGIQTKKQVASSIKGVAGTIFSDLGGTSKLFQNMNTLTA